MEKERIIEEIRNIARFGCHVFPKRPHCTDRLDERNGDMNDVLNVLEWGNVEEIEETPYGRFECRIKGKDIEGDDMTCCISLDVQQQSIMCRTIF